MALECSTCGLDIDIDSVNMETLTVTCPRCSTHLDFSDAIQPEENTPPEMITLPESFTVTKVKNGSQITFSWMNWRAIIYFTVGLVLAFTPVMIANVVGGEGFTFPIILLPVSLVATIVGMGVIYYSFALFLNSTRIIVDDETLSVKHGPLPLQRHQIYHRSDVAQVTSQQTARHTQYGEIRTYEVRLYLKDGTHKILVKGFNRKEQADYIRQQLYSAGIRA